MVFFLKEIKDSKIRIKKDKKNRKYDTLSITRELEKTLNIKVANDKYQKKKNIKKITVILFRIIAVLAIILIIVFFSWLKSPIKRNEYSNYYMNSKQDVQVVENKGDNIVFSPQMNSKIGLIIVPGEKIENKSYARLCNMLAKKGYTVFVPEVRFNFPAFSKGSVKSIIDRNPGIDTWILIGHSTSGRAVLKQAANIKHINGVVFMGAYSEGNDLKLINKPALSIWGTKDGILDFTKFEVYKKNMPSNSHYYEIVGGNNTNFADIEVLDGDNKSIISAEEQQQETANKIDDFIKELDK